ncbi:MAG: hypothetical protein HY368_02715 [Candidatus Aenigmarchaeota archaeon]|nr:hypothetical protein [Candidatus Aenigmarchaeota archaeon]
MLRWLVCIVEFLEFTGDIQLRAPAWKGLRDDKAPGECTMEDQFPGTAKKKPG